MNEMKSVFLVGFFKFSSIGPEYGFERIHLRHIWKTEQEARKNLSFCDEAGWYEGALIEERGFGHPILQKYNANAKRIWFIQKEDGHMEEIPELSIFKDCTYLI